MKNPEDYKSTIHKYRGSIEGINGWCTEEDAKEYKRLVSEVKNGNIMEVGAYEGLSLYHINDICKENNNKLYCVDFIAWPKLVENTKNWGIEFINLSSTEAAKKFPDGFFDLIYIDANHKKEDVLEDILTWLPKLKKEGVLAGHDCLKKGVCRVLKYVFGNLDLLTLTGLKYGGVWSIKSPHDKVTTL